MRMRGVVSGSPYGASGGQMAIPVLFSKMTLHDTGMRSPVGVIIMKKTQKVKLPRGAGYILPVNMRTGDRFKGTGVVTPVQRHAFYTRIAFPKATVTFRSKELSLAEISAAIDALRNALAQLQNQVNQLQAGTFKAFQDVYAQLADLRKQLASLQTLGVPNFQAQIDALNKRLDDLIAGLPDFSKFALVSQLPDLSQYAKLSDVTNMIGAAVAGLNLGQYATVTQVTTIKNKVNEIVASVNAVCTAIKTTLPATSCSTISTIP
ncbi:MAG: hypothetical protein ACJ76Z_10770 [Thermoleophilaceae bacterium]